MQLFYFLNGFAGRNALLDGAARAFYIAAIPLAATFLAALLIFRPSHFVDSRTRVGRIALATLAAIGVCLLLMSAVDWFAATVLQAPILSSRPAMVHWVNALVVEPNDNSFPAPECAVFAVLCLAIWATAPDFALISFVFGLLFGATRVFCGANYPSDVFVGLGGGFAVGALALSLCRVELPRLRWPRLRWPFFKLAQKSRPRRTGVSGSRVSAASVSGSRAESAPTAFAKLRYQTFFAGALALCTALAFGVVLDTPRHVERWRTFWSREENVSAKNSLVSATARIATLSPNSSAITRTEASKTSQIEYLNGDSARAATSTVSARTATSDASHEGEGGESAGAHSESGEAVGGTNTLMMAPVKEVPRPGTMSLGGNFPAGARALSAALQKAHLAHSLVSVDVALLRGDSENDARNEAHFAAVRFQVRGAGANERKSVANSAARIVRTAFALDEKLQNVDVVGVVLSDPERDKVKYAVFGDGTIPVFTASIQRKNLILPPSQAWLNAPNADAGLWLRARSRLYINTRVLPANSLAAQPAPLFQNAPTSNIETLNMNANANANLQPATPKSVIQKATIPRAPTSPTPKTPNSKTPAPSATQNPTSHAATPTPIPISKTPPPAPKKSLAPQNSATRKKVAAPKSSTQFNGTRRRNRTRVYRTKKRYRLYRHRRYD